MPLRIVSLLPSATEIISLVGAGPCLVGRSHECDFPTSFAPLPVLTGQVHKFESSRQMDEAVRGSLLQGKGLYTIDTALLRELRPDVIITQSVCSVCSVDLAAVREAVEGMTASEVVLGLPDDAAEGATHSRKEACVRMPDRGTVAQDSVSTAGLPVASQPAQDGTAANGTRAAAATFSAAARARHASAHAVSEDRQDAASPCDEQASSAGPPVRIIDLNPGSLQVGCLHPGRT